MGAKPSGFFKQKFKTLEDSVAQLRRAVWRFWLVG